MLNEREDVGNVGWFFGKWGQRSSKQGVQQNIDAQIKKKTCQIIGLCECQEATEHLLQASTAVAEHGETLTDRDGHEYLTIRGNEEVSVLLGVRSAVAESLELLSWRRIHEGTYNSKNTSKRKMNAYTRWLVGKITMKNQVGYMGRELRVAVCHLHFQVGNKNKGFRRNNDHFWKFVRDELVKHNVQVLMGDFNMSLFKVVPELRSCGVRISLAAWYPWRTNGDQPMADSCGIFMVNLEAVVTPKFDFSILSDDAWWELDEHEENGGPGQSLQTYLPKAQDITEKLRDSLEPAVADDGAGKGKPQEKGDPTQNPAVAGIKGGGKSKGKRTCLTVREKRLDLAVWRFRGDNHKGSHFPLAAFTNNVGRRSEERFIARAEKCRSGGMELLQRQHW